MIDQELEDAIELARNSHREAAKSGPAAALAGRQWAAANQAALAASLARCDGLTDAIKEARTGTGARTSEENAARKELLIALDPIIKGARRTCPVGSPERTAYGIGKTLSARSTRDLLGYAKYATSQLAPGENNAPPKAVLKGVLPAEIAAIGALAKKYKDADWAQGDARKTAAELLVQLRTEVETVLNPARRDLQGAADQAYTHRNPLQAAQRKAFGLQPNRPLND